MTPTRYLAAALAAAVLTLASCGSAPPGASTSPTDDAAGGADVRAATAAVEAGYTGNYGTPPVTGPAPASGKDIWIISPTQQVHNAAVLTEQAQTAAAAMGWTSQVCDGQNNANGAWATCVRQAVSAGTDAILLVSIDCAPVKQPITEAKAAGIAIVSMTSFDCDDPTQGGATPLFDTAAQFTAEVPTAAEFFRQQGRLRADWIIAATGGQAKVLHVNFQGVAFGSYLSEGFTTELATCAGCSIVGTVDITPQDLPLIRQKFETALLKAPQANAVAVDVDFILAAGVQQALAAANRPDLAVAGGECSLDSLGYIRDGKGVQMCIGSSLGYLSYAGIDALNRHFAGSPAVPSGLGWQLVTIDHNLPAAGAEYDSAVDYRAGFAKAAGRS
jgi:ribose transport system substrate-binding protein